MATYPDNLPALREVENDPGVAYDALQKNVVFAEDVNNIAAEILAIATELGTLPKGSFADVKTRLADMTTKTATAQSTANSKANKQNGVVVELDSIGYVSYDKTRNGATQNTAYWLETGSATTPLTCNVSGAHNDCWVELYAMVILTAVVWVEIQLWIDGVAASGWIQWTAESATRMTARMKLGFSLGAGNHTIQWKYRSTSASPINVRIIQPSMTVYKKVNI